MLSCVQETISVQTRKQGLLNITDQIEPIVVRSGMQVGLCTVFVRHTSCSLVIEENADPTARADLENWINRLAPENDPRYTHTLEGPDDMPAHIKSALTDVSLTIPVADGFAMLGTWQGIYLFEHRHAPHRRQVILHLIGQ